MSSIGSLTPTPSEMDTDDDDQLTASMADMSSSTSSSSRASSPQTPPPPSYRPRPSLTISYPMQPSNAASSRLNITFPPQNKFSDQPERFVAPAHPQSHHLHVLPPRKKTTRALIIDHTIWRLVRTRFAQARCELGMHVKLKSHAWHEETDSGRNAPGFHPFHADRHQHGNFGDPPEIDAASSDDESGEEAEDIQSESLYGKNNLKAKQRRDGGNGNGNEREDDDGDDDDEAMDVDLDDDEDDQRDQRRRTASHNKRHAPFLSARADGMQKVLFTILFQAEPSPPMAFSQAQADDSALYPMSINSTSLESLRSLPNRLRLGLMLLRIVDDLFGLPKTTAESLTAPPSALTSTTTLLPPSFLSRVPTVDTLPADLESLFQISNQSLSPAPKPTTSFFHTLSLPSSSAEPSSSGGFNNSGTNPKSFVFSWNNSAESLTGKPEPAIGGEPSSKTGARVGPPPSSSQTAVRPSIPRVDPKGGDPLNWRLHSRIILDDSHKQGTVHSTVRFVKHASGRTKNLYSLGCIPDPSSTTNVAPIPVARFSSSVIPLSFGSSSSSSSKSKTKTTTTTTTSNVPQQAYPIEKLKTLCLRHLREKCTICVRNSEARTRIGAGLLSTTSTRAGSRDGGSWFLDRRRRLSNQLGVADLISDFLRLSAYIISELQEYVVSDGEDEGEDEDIDDDNDDSADSENADSKSRSTSPCDGQQQHEHDHVTEEDMSHKPTGAWYSLLCGLITRAVLEGYISRGWKGSKYAEVLMGIGLGVDDDAPPSASKPNRAPDDSEVPHRKATDEDDEYLPEGTPSLIEACHILFDGFGKNIKAKEIKPPEREYISAMEVRMSEFLEIPHSCPDLATHLTGLSAKYPAEPVERAALQFCEAVSRWRGKPEIEMYKIKHKSEVSPSPDLWIRKYFQIPTPDHHHGLERNNFSPSQPGVERGAKRQLSPSPQRESSSPVSKKGKLESVL